MKKLKSVIATFLFCYLFWIIYTGAYGAYAFPEYLAEEFIGGAVVCLIIAYFSARFFVKEEPFWLLNPKRLGALIVFIPLYAVELLKANWDVAKRALSPNLNIKPGIVKIETELKSDYGLAMLANCITLTPGTISMDIVEEKGKCYMYIHWINVATKDVKQASDAIKGAFEPWVRRIFK
jgi:multicomponent Na+:H+ antiporter subunit E